MGAVEGNGPPDEGPEPVPPSTGADERSSNGSSADGRSSDDPSTGSGSAASPWAAPGWAPSAPEPATPAPGAAVASPIPDVAPGAGAPLRAATPGPYPPGPYPPTSGGYPPGRYVPGQYPPGHQGSGTYPPVPPAGGPPARPDRGWKIAPPARTHRWGIGAYLLVEVVFLAVSWVVGILVIGDAEPTAGILAIGLAVPTMLAAGTALLITKLRGNGPVVDLRLQWSRRDVGMGLAFGFGGLALTIPASLVYVTIVGQDASSAVGDVFGEIRTGPLLAVLILVIVVLIAPLCEEIVYRGLLWGGIERIAGRWVAFGVSTLLFALAHFEFTRTPLLLVVAIPIALARLYTGSLVSSIVAHQINNLLPGVALMLGLLGAIPMV